MILDLPGGAEQTSLMGKLLQGTLSCLPWTPASSPEASFLTLFGEYVVGVIGARTPDKRVVHRLQSSGQAWGTVLPYLLK